MNDRCSSICEELEWITHINAARWWGMEGHEVQRQWGVFRTNSIPISVR